MRVWLALVMLAMVLLGPLCGLEVVADAWAAHSETASGHHHHEPGRSWSTCELPAAVGASLLAQQPTQAPLALPGLPVPLGRHGIVMLGEEVDVGLARPHLFLLHASLLT